ncbi:MAG: lysophospholipid acyltransferase family protein [Ignavibacteria bacterium]|jgi:hypothetical protein|nr:lysophospholipid acyltransferase family protein [Ignavibacteria bacterium]MDP3831111.1 lysophospholipid acyltransferase family protein [Ignavibacteriaceae bacterium]
MKLNQFSKNVLRFIGNYSLLWAVNILCATLRVEVLNGKAIAELEKSGKRFVAAFWHGTMLFPWYFFRGQKILGITSQSKDGDLLAKTLKYWKFTVVRGSSSKGGDVALGIMVDYAKNEGSVVITPDGPTGPKEKFKAGAVITAKKSGVPLFLMGVAYQNKIALKSWDRFEIPKPFSKVRVIFSDKIEVPSVLSYEETSKVIEICEVQLSALQKEAAKFN